MPIFDIVVVLVLIGVALYLIDKVPMDATVRQIIRVVIILVVVLWLVQAFGLLEPLRQYRIGKG